MSATDELGAAELRPVTPAAIIAVRLAELARRAAASEGIDATIRTELRELSELAGGLDPYLERCASPPSLALHALAERTLRHDWDSAAGSGLEPEMLSGHVEGKVLQMLVYATRARHVLEIGMFTGYAALAMAEALPENGRMITCEIDPDVAALAGDLLGESPAGSRISVQIGPARDTLAALAAAGQSFDLIFLDADKAGYADYFRMVLDFGLLRSHGLLCVDNTLLQGEPWMGARTPNGAAIASFNDLVAADPRVEQVIVPLRDGLTLIRRCGAQP
jgi:caffeoyl-CoA O-methyltransferase